MRKLLNFYALEIVVLKKGDRVLNRLWRILFEETQHVNFFFIESPKLVERR